jgi:hypothetical protein
MIGLAGNDIKRNLMLLIVNLFYWNKFFSKFNKNSEKIGISISFSIIDE